MQIDTAGTYLLKYTAEDDCGNVTEVTREVVAEAPPTYRTVLYTDGTFIINESSRDQAANEAEHGAATNVYIPFNPNGATDVDKYIFGNAGNAPWSSQRALIKSVEIGSPIKPTSTAYWFYSTTNCESIDFSNLDTSAVTDMSDMFGSCSASSLDLSSFNTSAVTNMGYMFENADITDLDLSNFDTTSVTDMSGMFNNCGQLETLDLTSFDTSNVLRVNSMFSGCTMLSTIYASQSFDVSTLTDPNDRWMFTNMSTNLVGGAGTTWNSNNPTNRRYAHIDGGTSNPGYFTARSA